MSTACPPSIVLIRSRTSLIRVRISLISALSASRPVHDPLGGVGDGLDGSRRGRDGFAAKGGVDAFGAGGSDAAFSERGFDGGQAHAAGFLRGRDEGPEIEGPVSPEVRSGLEEGGGSSA